jgi:CHAT domain-containing protein
MRGAQSAALRTFGILERAWGEAIEADRSRPSLFELRQRHKLLGETASSALSLGFPEVALIYQNLALTDPHGLQDAPTDPAALIAYQTQKAIALRARADIEVQLHDYDAARNDLAEAKRLIDHKGGNKTVVALVKTRISEVEGEALLREAPQNAVKSFAKALETAQGDEFSSYRIVLQARLAQARFLTGDRVAGERDLGTALQQLRQEQSEVLSSPDAQRVEGEWSSYFARFQETYHILIRQLVEQGRDREAFAYAEEARAFEPLNLIRRLGSAPPAFRRIVPAGGTVALADLQKTLPPGTFVVQYCVLDDRTYAWIISQDHFEMATLDAKASDIQRWSANLQRAAEEDDRPSFEDRLLAPYDKLVREPLARIRAFAGKDPARLVLVPDDAMYGLPFAALRDSETGPYLITTAPIEIAGSATLYVYSLLRDRALPAEISPTILLLGDPERDERMTITRDLPPLDGARREVEQIEEIYKHAPAATTLTGPDATLAKLIELGPSRTIIHIAAHSLANGTNPSRSVLVLARSDKGPSTVDAMELLKVLQLPKTRLVVLSVCSSGGGVPIGPEGIAPLVRPLLGAGVPGIVGTLWNISDATAGEVTVSMHRHYREGSDAAVALQQAQLDLIKDKDPKKSSPLVWAPFEVIGHSSSPYPRPP